MQGRGSEGGVQKMELGGVSAGALRVVLRCLSTTELPCSLSYFSNDVLTCFSVLFLIQERMSGAAAWALFPVLSVAEW